MSNFKIETSPCGEKCLLVERPVDFFLTVREIIAGRLEGEVVQYRSSKEEQYWFGHRWFYESWLDEESEEPVWVGDDHPLPDWVFDDEKLSPYED